jgi:hypothetical protein
LNSSDADGHVLFSPVGLSQADYFRNEADLDLIVEMAQSVFVDEDVIPFRESNEITSYFHLVL